MKIVETDKLIKVLSQESTLDTKILLNWKKKKNDSWIYVENNVINRLVLGLPPLYCKNTPTVDPWAYNDPALEEFQVADIRKGIKVGDVLNRNKMGFGKTVETIFMLRSMYVRDAVICAPKSVCPQWKAQFAEWWPEVAETVELYDPYAEICVINYDKLRNEEILLKLRSRRHDAVVFDEIHKLKNRGAQQTKAAKLIPAQWHIGLTGTPILRQPDDLWSILNAIDWHYSGTSYWAFVNYFCNVVEGPFGRKIEGVTESPERLAMLHKLLDLVSIHNPDIEVAKGKRIIPVQLEMSPKQAALYKKIRDLVLDELPENCTIANGAVHAMRMQQTTSWPGLFDVDTPGAKFEWVLNFCQSTDEQILVLTKFAKTAAALRKYLLSEGVSNGIYTGQVDPIVKETSKRIFIEGKCQVLIGTIDSIGTGTDGLQVARLGIMLDQDWSPEINKQCEDRLHRRGQDRPVRWYYLSCNKTFDKYVGRVNLAKSDAIRAALGED